VSRSIGSGAVRLRNLSANGVGFLKLDLVLFAKGVCLVIGSDGFGAGLVVFSPLVFDPDLDWVPDVFLFSGSVLVLDPGLLVLLLPLVG